MARRYRRTSIYYKDAVQKAGAAVSSAVRKGLLPNLRRNPIKCVDCGARASGYDHRDYNQPLLVEPVYQSCNVKRGQGKFVPYPGQKVRKSSLSQIIQVPKPLYHILKREAQARGCFIWKVLDDAVKCYLASRKASK